MRDESDLTNATDAVMGAAYETVRNRARMYGIPEDADEKVVTLSIAFPGLGLAAGVAKGGDSTVAYFTALARTVAVALAQSSDAEASREWFDDILEGYIEEFNDQMESGAVPHRGIQ